MSVSEKVRDLPGWPPAICTPTDASDSPADDSDMEIVEDDLGFSQDKITKSGRKPYEVDFKVYSPQDIHKYQEKQIDDVCNILGQPPEITAILLRHMRWNKERLIEQYMDRQEEMLEAVGLGEDNEGKPQIKKMQKFSCEICCNDEPGIDTFAMKCGHRFCAACYKQYLSQKIKEEGEAARIRCPGDGCNRVVDSKSLDLLVASELKERCVAQVHRSPDCSTNTVQVPRASYPNIRRRQREPQVVPCPQLCVRRRLRRQGPRPAKGSTYRTVHLWPPLLLWLHPQRPPARPLQPGAKVDEEVRGRLRDGKLDIGKHEGVPQMPVHD